MMGLRELCFSAVFGLSISALSPIETQANARQQDDSLQKINVAGRQRMLTQRIAASACFARLGIEKKVQSDTLQSARTLFEKSLNALSAGNSELGIFAEQDPKVLGELESVRSLWAQFGELIDGSSNGDRNATEQLITASLPILGQSNRVVKALVASRGAGGTMSPELARTVDVAGRQRMLSQKIAKASCAALSGIFPKKSREELELAVMEFETAMVGLAFGGDGLVPAPSQKIAFQLEIVQEIWGEVRGPVLRVAGQEDLSLDEQVVIARRTNDLLREMNKAVGMYSS